MATPSKPRSRRSSYDLRHEAGRLVAPDLRVGDVADHHRLGAVVDQLVEGDEVGVLEVGEGGVVHRVAEVRIAGAPVAGEVLHA